MKQVKIIANNTVDESLFDLENKINKFLSNKETVYSVNLYSGYRGYDKAIILYDTDTNIKNNETNNDNMI